MAARIEILLATRNGATHLEEMLKSLLGQSRDDFVLRVRDDASTDATLDILEDYRGRFGGRLVVMPQDGPSGSAKGNFARLMAASEAERLMFADQDDFWSTDHVAEIDGLLASAAEERGPKTPVYAFTDVVPVDRQLAQLAESFFDYKGIDPAISRRLSQSLVCPPMLGCASGINRALLNLALPLPVDEVTGHDWWALLLASAVGHCTWSGKKTALYRLHGGNTSGQVASDVRVYARMGGKVAKVRRGMMLRRRQAAAVRARVAHIATPEVLAVLDGFDALMDRGFLLRRFLLVSGRYLYPDLTRNLGMLTLC